MRVADFRITRFQYARDRVIGDSQVRIEDMHVATLELIADTEEKMRAETETVVNEIKESLSLLRRHL